METGIRLKKNGDILSNRKGFVHCAKGKGEGFSEAGNNYFLNYYKLYTILVDSTYN